MEEIIIEGPGKIKILPASSGVQELTELTREQRIYLLTQLESLQEKIDILLIDTAAGISSNVIYFNLAAQEIIIVVSPEPTSLTDGYALIKVLSTKYAAKHFKLVVNYVGSPEEGEEIFKKLSLVIDKFLNVSLDYLGFILKDPNLVKAVRQQRIVQELYPDSAASKCFFKLAQRILELPLTVHSQGNIQFFGREFFRG